ncbi:MAG: hypothetical protein GWN93_26810 [Deltaproteobacteria bacterium]|nr:hypothetical protein [Deltaproteobacteria bacterium]
MQFDENNIVVKLGNVEIKPARKTELYIDPFYGEVTKDIYRRNFLFRLKHQQISGWSAEHVFINFGDADSDGICDVALL